MNILKKGERAVLQYSGGKDSTALLYLCKDELKNIDVIFCDPGAILPHVVKFVHGVCTSLGVNLITISPPMGAFEYVNQVGLPADIPPVERHKAFIPLRADGAGKLPVQSWMDCCAANYFYPMARFIEQQGYKVVLRGTKKSDPRVGVPDGFVDQSGVEYRSPLWNWSDEQVFAYLAVEGVELPNHYATVKDSIDCWFCTARMGSVYHGKERLEYIKAHYPNIWPELQHRVDLLRRAMTQEWEELRPAFTFASEG